MGAFTITSSYYLVLAAAERRAFPEAAAIVRRARGEAAG